MGVRGLTQTHTQSCGLGMGMGLGPGYLKKETSILEKELVYYLSQQRTLNYEPTSKPFVKQIKAR
jgi:hypothetical protein